MGKYVSDGERLAIASLNRKETELKETKEQLENLKAQLRAMSGYITELKDANKMLGAQVNYLVRRQLNNA
jgi:predicted RNase H-like nuclease (RuvC/YqgF family)